MKSWVRVDFRYKKYLLEKKNKSEPLVRESSRVNLKSIVARIKSKLVRSDRWCLAIVENFTTPITFLKIGIVFNAQSLIRSFVRSFVQRKTNHYTKRMNSRERQKCAMINVHAIVSPADAGESWPFERRNAHNAILS